MTREISTCTPADDLRTAARIMWDVDCGCVPVLGGPGEERVVGMMTDRDVCMAAYRTGKPLAELTVGDCMTKEVTFCTAQESVEEAERRMGQARVRRLPVLGGEGQLLGLVTVADLARQAASRSGGSWAPVRNADLASVLSAISTPRGAAATASAS